MAIQKNPTHQKIIEDNLAKVSMREQCESSAEQAENWIHVTPRPKVKVNNNNLK